METDSSERVSMSETSENSSLRLKIESASNSIENSSKNGPEADTTGVSIQIDDKIINSDYAAGKLEIQDSKKDTKENDCSEKKDELEAGESQEMGDCQIELMDKRGSENVDRARESLENSPAAEISPRQQKAPENLSGTEESGDSRVANREISAQERGVTARPKLHNANTSLAFLASAYNSSDSENEDSENGKEKIDDCENYRNDATICSTDEESDSDSSDSSSKQSDCVESTQDESDEEEDARGKSKKLQKTRNTMRERETKGEFDDLPPIEELQIFVPEVLCDPLGEVGWMVDQMVVVKPKAEKPTLNLDTVLFLDRGRRVLGRIFDVFGQVSEPHYCVRFNSSEHIKQSEIKVGMTVYFCPNTPYTSVVFVNDLLKMKATEEISDQEHPEFSDDAEEKAYYASLNKKPKEKAKNVPNKRQKTSEGANWRSNHPWNSGKNQDKRNQKTHRPNQTMEASRVQSKNSKNHNESSTNPNENGPHNYWQYPSYRWPIPRGQSPNNWPNSYPYNEQHNQHQNAQFYQQQQQQVGPNPYNQNIAYQNNLPRFPMANFPWQSQAPRFPGYWPFPPPPPPGV